MKESETLDCFFSKNNTEINHSLPAVRSFGAGLGDELNEI